MNFTAVTVSSSTKRENLSYLLNFPLIFGFFYTWVLLALPPQFFTREIAKVNCRVAQILLGLR